MNEVHKVMIKPVWVGGSSGYRYDVFQDDVLIIEKSRTPLCDASRRLGGEGKNGKVEVWRYGGSGPCMIGEIQRYASLTITETDRSGPRFTKWSPFPQEARRA